MKLSAGFALFALVLSSPAWVSATELNTDEQKFSYTIGVNLGNILKSQGISDVDDKAFTAGLIDMLEGNKLKLNVEQMKMAVENQQKKLLEEAEQAAQVKVEQGKAFLAKNKQQAGVVELENGLQYLVLKKADGDKPAATDTVTVHYHGTLIDGTVFDSSVQRGEPTSFALDRVIAGFREAITRMSTGAKWRVFVPSDLGYGEQGAGGKIGPNETLIFEIELLSIKTAD